MEKIHLELKKHNITKFNTINIIREKNGIGVYEVSSAKGNHVLKVFYNKTFTREIEYYKLLNKMDIKTIEVISYSENSILLENINFSDKYRLGNEDDFKSKAVANALANWYKSLHTKGEEYFQQNEDTTLYSEYSAITSDALDTLFKIVNYQDKLLSKKIMKVLSYTNEYLRKNKTLTYNDFYYVNLIVSKDQSEAFMFDYNYLGEGLRCSDYNNVTCWFNDDLKKIFLDNYGTINPIEFEISKLLGPIFGLIQASKCDIFPDWGKEPLDILLSGTIEKDFDTFIKEHIRHFKINNSAQNSLSITSQRCYLYFTKS